MNSRDRKMLLAFGGLALISFGHRLADAEFGELGVPHAVGAGLVALAVRS